MDGGTITIGTCYEGLESADIELNGGVIDLTASDDGINASTGSGSTQGMIESGGGKRNIQIRRNDGNPASVL